MSADTKLFDAVIAGAAIIDMLIQPVDSAVFRTGSKPVEAISMEPGGDALNEAVILSRLGADVRLVSKTGDDYAGMIVREHCRKNGLNTDYILTDKTLDTGINAVLIDAAAERYFLTNPHSTLRKIRLEDIPAALFGQTRLFCLASIFVYPELAGKKLITLFQEAKRHNLILCADMTKAKNKETLSDIAEALSYLDYVFPNYEEASLVSGLTDPDAIGDAFLACGVKNAVIKLGRKGCLVCNKNGHFLIPGYQAERCIDTTGAGDTFAAAFIYGLIQSWPPVKCAAFANAAASFAIETIGATSGVQSLEQVMHRFRSN